MPTRVGNHIIMQTEAPNHHRVSIPGHKPLRTGTLNAILCEVSAAKNVSREAVLDTLRVASSTRGVGAHRTLLAGPIHPQGAPDGVSRCCAECRVGQWPDCSTEYQENGGAPFEGPHWVDPVKCSQRIVVGLAGAELGDLRHDLQLAGHRCHEADKRDGTPNLSAV